MIDFYDETNVRFIQEKLIGGFSEAIIQLS
jgi:hypothetical protein